MTANDKTLMPDLDGCLALETRIWQALVDGDAAADRALLTQDFLGVYPSGFATRAEHADALADGPSMASFSLDRARLRVLTPDAALLSYRATHRRAGTVGDAVMYITSLWERRDGGWVNSFSQDTPAL